MSLLPPVTLLAWHAYGHGGVARSVLGLAGMLAEHRDVRVVSLFRRHDEPAFDLDPRVPLEVLVDERDGRQGPRARARSRRPTRLSPPPSEQRMSAHTDRVLKRFLRSLGPGVLITSRPSLHLAAVRWCPPDVRLVGQDHKNFVTRFANRRQAALLRDVVPDLDAYVVLTNADAEDYTHELPDLDTHVAVIRNATPWAPVPSPVDPSSRVVVAAGRLAREKGFDRLLDAFAPVAAAHRDWQLHVHGQGIERAALLARVRTLGLDRQVRLLGHTEDLATALDGASVFAMASRAEGFPMVLIEAMSRGLPLVAYDCPRGPGEVVVDGKNGLLVDDGDQAGLTRALESMVGDEPLRRRCGAQALRDAGQYTPARVAEDWLGLLERVERPDA